VFEQCDECESLDVVSYVAVHDESTLEYHCRACGAEWIDYIDSYSSV